MKIQYRLFFMITIALLFGGCATSGPKFTEMTDTLNKISPNRGRIYIYRTAIFGAAVQPEVRLNEEVVGKAIPKGFFYVDKEAGHYEIMTSTEVDRKLSLTLEKGQTRYVRLNIAMGFFVGHVYPELIEEEVGKKEIQELRYTGIKK